MQLTEEQKRFLDRVGAGRDDVLEGATGTAVFVYVEQATRTVRYEVTPAGEARSVDAFPLSPAR